MAGLDEARVVDLEHGRAEGEVEQRGQAVAALGCGGEAEAVEGGHGRDHVAEGGGRDVVALVDDQRAEARPELGERRGGEVHQRLHLMARLDGSAAWKGERRDTVAYRAAQA